MVGGYRVSSCCVVVLGMIEGRKMSNSSCFCSSYKDSHLLCSPGLSGNQVVIEPKNASVNEARPDMPRICVQKRSQPTWSTTFPKTAVIFDVVFQYHDADTTSILMRFLATVDVESAFVCKWTASIWSACNFMKPYL